MERVIRPSSISFRSHPVVRVLIGVFVLSVSVALGGKPTLLYWVGQQLVDWAPSILASGLLYTAPGLALIRVLWPTMRPLGLAEQLALAVGLSTAMPPLLLLLAQQLGLAWNTPTTWAYVLVSLIILIWPSRASIAQSPLDRLRRAWIAISFDGPSVAVAGISIAALLARCYTVRDLPTGLLGDSYQHTLMAQLLVDNAGLFHSWQPYAPLTTFTYHFGFHANAAFIHWVSGLDVVRSTLWSGQLINALSVPLAFVLTKRLSGKRWAGVWAALITGFVSTLPAFYVYWGRYTQLTGQVVLVAVLICWAELADQLGTKNKEQRTAQNALWRLLLLTALVTAAQLLTHYLVSIFAALFVGSYLLIYVLAARSWKLLLQIALAGAAVAGAALLLDSPWIFNMLNGYLVRNTSGFLNGGVGTQRIAEYATIPPLTTYTKSYILLGAALGLCIAGWQRCWRMVVPGLWSILLVLCVIPHVVGLPGTGIIDYLTALSVLYLPLAPLVGYAMATSQEGLARAAERIRAGALFKAVPTILIIGTISWGTQWQIQIVDGSTQLVTPADMEAMAWIQSHTPTDARFLVNSFPAYGGTLAAGTDAGWWIPLLAQRPTSLPPLPYGSELGEHDLYWKEINDLTEALRGRPLTDPTPVQIDLTTSPALEKLRQANIRYIYSGAHPVPDAAHADRIDTTQLRRSRHFRLIYDRAGVNIFQLVEQHP